MTKITKITTRNAPMPRARRQRFELRPTSYWIEKLDAPEPRDSSPHALFMVIDALAPRLPAPPRRASARALAEYFGRLEAFYTVGFKHTLALRVSLEKQRLWDIPYLDRLFSNAHGKLVRHLESLHSVTYETPLPEPSTGERTLKANLRHSDHHQESCAHHRALAEEAQKSLACPTPGRSPAEIEQLEKDLAGHEYMAERHRLDAGGAATKKAILAVAEAWTPAVLGEVEALTSVYRSGLEIILYDAERELNYKKSRFPRVGLVSS